MNSIKKNRFQRFFFLCRIQIHNRRSEKPNSSREQQEYFLNMGNIHTVGPNEALIVSGEFRMGGLGATVE